MKDKANNYTNHGIITNEILRPFRDELAEVKIKSVHKSMDKVNNQQFSLEKYSSVNKSINFPNDELPRKNVPHIARTNERTVRSNSRDLIKEELRILSEVEVSICFS